MKRNRRKTKELKFIIIAALILLISIFTGVEISIFFSTPGPITPRPGELITVASPELSFSYSSSPDLIEVKLDGKTVKNVRFEKDRALFKAENLWEGNHILEIIYKPLLSIWPIKKIWEFTIDISPPVITLNSPVTKEVSVNNNKFLISGKTEKGCSMEIVKDDKIIKTKLDNSGNFEKEFILNTGKNKFKIISTDKAGNSSDYEINVLFDSMPPELSSPFPPEGKIVKEIDPLISVNVKEDGIIDNIEMKINNETVPWELDSTIIKYRPEKLAEGTHNIIVEVTDSVGLKDTIKWSFTVDSTEFFGKRIQIFGATGEDARVLQQRLANRGYLKEGDITGVFDKKTLKAVKKFQKDIGLEPDGVIGPATVSKLSFSIVVDLDDFALYLYQDDEIIKSYFIACGSMEYPTPTGEFIVTNKIKDPTWIPPDSLWAQEAEITEPGPDNPLGTRWIELNSSLVGIHGTNYPETIGMNVSHGCIRMTIPEVEELYEYVDIGTMVTIEDQILPPPPTPEPQPPETPTTEPVEIPVPTITPVVINDDGNDEPVTIEVYNSDNNNDE